MSDKVFTGGGKMMSALDKLVRKLKNESFVEVGFLEGSTYPDGTSVPMVAALQEFGAPSVNIPPRPFFRNMIAKESPHWGADMAVLLKSTDYDSEKVLALMGTEIKSELQDSIDATNEPALKPATVARKGFDKPLIDTAHMKNSIDFKVK